MSTIISGNTPSSFGDDVSAPNLILPEAPVVGYQQGLWVPTMILGTNNNLNPDQNYWYRIGNAVTLAGYLNDWTDTSSADWMAVQGVPYSFTVNSAAGSVMATRCGEVITTTFMNSGLQGIVFYASATSTANSWQSLTHSGTNSATQIRFTASYITDDTTWVPSNGATVS